MVSARLLLKVVSVLLLFSSLACREDATEVSNSIIDGIWETECLEAANSTSEIIRYTFLANNSVERRLEIFSDASCSTPSAELRHEGVFALAVRQADTLYDIDMIFRRVVGLPKTADAARLWNDEIYCGISRWLAGKEETVEAQTDPRCAVYGRSSIEYRDIISLDGDSRLSFGDELNSTRPRPEIIDAQNPRKVFLLKSP